MIFYPFYFLNYPSADHNRPFLEINKVFQFRVASGSYSKECLDFSWKKNAYHKKRIHELKVRLKLKSKHNKPFAKQSAHVLFVTSWTNSLSIEWCFSFCDFKALSDLEDIIFSNNFCERQIQVLVCMIYTDGGRDNIMFGIRPVTISPVGKVSEEV